MQAISALDALVQYLIEEISMDGDAGTDVSRLDTIVADFYSPARSTSTIAPPQQNLDEYFLNFIWNILCEQDDISIGIIDAEVQEEEEGGEEGKPKSKGKKKGSMKGIVSQALLDLSAEEVAMGKKSLIEKYGDNLRITVNADVSWAALTTSHVKLKTITPPVYKIIQLVAREKGAGATTIQIGTALGIDQKSAFHYVRSAVNAGALKKFKTTAGGCATNRLVHTRYLSVSKEWKIHLIREKALESDDEAAEGSGDEDVGLASNVMTIISAEYLLTNSALIESRILRVVKTAPERTLAHRAIVSSIGIRNYERADLRRLRTVIARLVDAGRLERINVVTPGQKGAAELCLRFISRGRDTDEKPQVGIQLDQVEDDEDEADEASQPHALWNTTIERQVFDLLAAADMDGLCLHDFRVAFAGFNTRTIEMILFRYEKSPPPAHLADYQIHSVTENFGREKRTRFFLLSGYLRRLRVGGFPSGPLSITNQAAIGDWSELETTGFYSNEEELKRWTGRNLKTSRPTTTSTSKKRSRPSKAKPKEGEPAAPPTAAEIEKEAKRVKKAEQKAAREAEKLKKLQGKWIAGGKTTPFVPPLSYYDRKKLEAAERAAKGLAPIPKRAASGGGRRSKAVLAAMALAKAEGREYIGSGGEGEGSRASSEAKEDTPVVEGDQAIDAPQDTNTADAQDIVVVEPHASEQSSPLKKARKKATPKGKKLDSHPALPVTPIPVASVTSPAPIIPVAIEPIAGSSKAQVVTGVKGAKGRVSNAAGKKGKGKEVVQISEADMEVDELEEEVPAVVVEPIKRASSRGSTLAATATSLSITTPLTSKAKSVVPATTISSPANNINQKESSKKATAQNIVVEIPPPPPATISGKKRVRIAEESPIEAAVPQSSILPSESSPIIKNGKGKGREEAYLEVLVPASKKARLVSSTSLLPLVSPRIEVAPLATPAPAALISTKDIAATPSLEQKNETPTRQLSSKTAFVKTSLTALSRQTDLLDYIRAKDGIILNENKLSVYVKEFLEQREQSKPEKDRKPVFTMDRNVITSTLKDLTLTNAVKFIVLAASASLAGRYDTYYLADLSLESPAAKEYQRQLAEKEKDRKTKAPLLTVEGVPKPLPATTDNFDTIREFFLNDRNVLSAQYGVYLGRFARARALHQFMVDFVLSNPESPLVVRRDGLPLILAHSTIHSELPLHICLRIYPIPTIAPELDNYLAQPGNSLVLIKDLPAAIYRILSIEFSKRGILTAIMQYLCDLYLIQPLVQTSEGEFERPQTLRLTTHWQLQHVAPIYGFKDKNPPLIAVLPIDTPEAVTEYWTQLKYNSTNLSIKDRVTITHPDFPSRYDTKISTSLRRIISSATRWYDQYSLRGTQIHLIEQFVEEGKHFDDNALIELARAMLAPVEVVRAKLDQLRAGSVEAVPKGRKSRAAKGRKTKSSKRRKIEQEGEDEGEAEEGQEEGEATSDREEESVEEEEARPIVSMKKSLGKKAKDEILQREKDFTAIFERFKREVGVPSVPDKIIQFLSNKFCSTASSRLDVNALDNELRLLLPEPADVVLDLKYHSVIPASLFKSAELDPYALPRRITHKPMRKDKGVPKPLPPIPRSEFRPDEFLLAPAPAVPVLAKGQRLPRHFYTAEQDDLLFDAAAIIKSRATYLGKTLAWAPTEVLFPGLTASKLRTHFLQLMAKPEDQAYHQRLQEAWMTIWNSKRGTPELPDPNHQSPRDFDIVPFVRLLRHEINKQALRLAGPAINVEPKLISAIDSLPSSLEELYELYEVHASPGNTDAESKFSSYWKGGTGNLTREHIITNISFSSGYKVDESKDAVKVDQDLALTIATLKMVLATPTPSYTEVQAFTLLKPFESHLIQAVDILTSNSVLAKQKSETDRRVPGRGFFLNEKYLSNFENLLTIKSIEDAETKLNDVIKGDDDLWPLEASQGPILSLLYLVSRDAIEMTIDLSVLEDLRDPNDYETRKANDEHIEANVNITYTGEVAPRTETIPKIWPSRLITSDPESLEEALTKLQSRARTHSVLLSEINDSIRNSGSFGVTRSQLSLDLKPQDMSENDFTVIVESLLNLDLPLAFWAGYSTPVIVSSQFLSKWTIRVFVPPSVAPTPPVSKKGKGKQKAVIVDVEVEVEDVERSILPVLWIDMKGNIVPELYSQAVAWLKGTLLTCAGATASQIAAKGVSGCLVTLIETMILLEALEKAGYVERGAPSGWFEGGEEQGEPTWDVAQWYLKDWLRV